MQVKDLFGTHYAQAAIGPVAAATATEKHVVFRAPFGCLVRTVRTAFGAAVTGANTDTKHINLQNIGTGAGTTEIGNIDYVSGTNALIGAHNTLYNSATGTALAAGESLMLVVEQIGTGQAIPSQLITIGYVPNPAVA